MSAHSGHLIPPGQEQIRDNILEKGSATGVSGDKSAWAKELDLPRTGEYTLFAGCGYQFMKYAEGMVGAVQRMEKVGIGMDRMVGVSRAFSKVGIDLPTLTAKVASGWKEDHYTGILRHAVSVLQKLEFDLGYMYEEEPCCGSPLYYAGFVDECIEKARHNHELFTSRGIRKIIGFIPACTSLLKTFYPKHVEGFDLEVRHFFEVVARALREKKVRPTLKHKKIVTYHDPCQLSRYLRIIDEPREIMSAIDGLELREPDAMQCRQWSTCCGGGGLEASNPQLSERLGIRRMEELLATGASIITTNCPACMMQLRNSAKKMKSDVQILDLVEILDEALQ